MSKYPIYTFDSTPLPLIEEACQKRQNGRHCELYKKSVRKVNGEKAEVHECNGNPAFCDHIMGIALKLSRR